MYADVKILSPENVFLRRSLAQYRYMICFLLSVHLGVLPPPPPPQYQKKLATLLTQTHF